MLQIIYQDEDLVAINKPNGMLVHRSSIAADASVFVLQELRNQLGGTHIYPVHRLDRKTSGVLVFGLRPEVSAAIQKSMESEETEKRYLAIVRGWFPEVVEVDYALTNDAGKTQEAQTNFRCLQQSEIAVPLGKHPSSRYSLIEAFPKTGRQHQIRKHLNHLRHPIIGDRPHGCSKQNKLFLERWQMNTMLLHAVSLSLPHPVTKEPLLFKAEFPSEFERMLTVLQLKE